MLKFWKSEPPVERVVLENVLCVNQRIMIITVRMIIRESTGRTNASDLHEDGVKEKGAGLKVAYGGESMRAYLARGLRAMNGPET